jgi:hypothetical protein
LADKLERLVVASRLIVLVEQSVEDGPFGRHAGEQGGGGFQASVDNVMAEAARLLLREIIQEQPETKPAVTISLPDPLLGAWRDDVDLLYEIVAHAMKNREDQPGRLSPSEQGPA